MDFPTKDNGLQSNTLKNSERDQHCNAVHSLTPSKIVQALQCDMIRRAQLILPKPKKLVRLDDQVSRPLQNFCTSMRFIQTHLSFSSPPLLSPIQFAALGHQSQTSRHLCSCRHPRCCRQTAAHGHSKHSAYFVSDWFNRHINMNRYLRTKNRPTSSGPEPTRKCSETCLLEKQQSMHRMHYRAQA
jgi:hypothetical protein